MWCVGRNAPVRIDPVYWMSLVSPFGEVVLATLWMSRTKSVCLVGVAGASTGAIFFFFFADGPVCVATCCFVVFDRTSLLRLVSVL